MRTLWSDFLVWYIYARTLVHASTLLNTTKPNMSKKQAAPDERQPLLLSLPERLTTEQVRFPQLRPVWTEKKALLIARYLYYFVYITRSGSYIDGFAGPQQIGKPETWHENWAAHLVLQEQPEAFSLRHYYLFDIGKPQVAALKGLRKRYPKRDIHVFRADFNTAVTELLKSKAVREKEATFCLLDQQTFECHWSTVKALAEYKEMKIELLYFLPIAWLDRALAAQRDQEKIRTWWGRNDWEKLRLLNGDQRRSAFTERFQELGYRSVTPWPIYQRGSGGRVMYYMIHASDHPEAPRLMMRAYTHAVRKPRETYEQLVFDGIIPPQKLDG